MFAITKRQRTKRMLIKQYQLSLQLESEIDTLKSSSSGSELDSLQIEEFQLRLEKLSILFDSLKYTYDGFTKCTFKRDGIDQWNLRKPRKSEGTLFKSDIPLNEHIFADGAMLLDIPSIVALVDSHELMSNNLYMTSLLREAIKNRVIDIYISKARDILHQNNRDIDDEQLLYAIILYINSSGNEIVLYQRDGIVMDTTLEIVAKVARTNIILI